MEIGKLALNLIKFPITRIQGGNYLRWFTKLTALQIEGRHSAKPNPMLENIFDNKSTPCLVKIIFIAGDLLINAIAFIKKKNKQKKNSNVKVKYFNRALAYIFQPSDLKLHVDTNNQNVKQSFTKKMEQQVMGRQH